MSNPYGPPAGGGQQGPSSYPGQGPAAWGPGQGAGPYGAPPSYGQPAPGSPGTPGSQGYTPGPAFGGPGQGGPGQGHGQGPGSPGSDGPGQWGGPQPSSAAPQKAPKPPKAPRPPRAPGTGPDLGKILPLISGVLGVIAFIAGFLPTFSVGDGDTSVSVSVFGGGPSYLPILLLVVGLLAVAPLIPGGKRYSLITVLLSVAGLLGAIGALATRNVIDLGGSSRTSTGFGLILLLIVAVLLVGSTGYGWLTESSIMKPGARSASRPSTGHGPSPYSGTGPSSSPSGPSHAAPSGPSSQGSYGGYPSSGGYQPPAESYQPPAESYQPYGQPSSEPLEPTTSGQSGPSSTAAPNTGSTPAADPRGYGSSYGQGSGGGQHGRDDGPPPDVTQQVRF